MILCSNNRESLDAWFCQRLMANLAIHTTGSKQRQKYRKRWYIGRHENLEFHGIKSENYPKNIFGYIPELFFWNSRVILGNYPENPRHSHTTATHSHTLLPLHTPDTPLPTIPHHCTHATWTASMTKKWPWLKNVVWYRYPGKSGQNAFQIFFFIPGIYPDLLSG